VTRDGWGRGSSFEGRERRGERGGRDGIGSFTGRGDESAGARNAANPRTGSGMQQPRDPAGGGSRRGGAKPRGRNGTAEVAPPTPKPSSPGERKRARISAGVDTCRPRRWRGSERPIERKPGRTGQAQERKVGPRRASGEPDPSRTGALDGSEDHGGSLPTPAMAAAARTGRKTSGAAPETVNGRGGGGEGQPPATSGPRRAPSRASAAAHGTDRRRHGPALATSKIP